MQNLLITGISGFVGSAAAEYFLAQGYNVVGLVKDKNHKTRPEIQAKCSIIYGDIRDKECLRYILSKYEIDKVLHLAAQPIVRICNNDPYTAYETNVMGTLNLLESIRNLKTRPKKIIVMTSDKAYGAAPVPYKEDTPLAVADSYCTSKLCQDVIAQSYAKTYDLPICVVRAGNLYGPGDLNLSRLIPNNILQLLRGENATLYSGVANYKREFIYIDNIVNAYDVLFQHGQTGEAYNVGDNRPYKILDVITTIKDKINPTLKVEITEKEFNEIEEQYLDATKLQKLGWTNFVNLSEGLDRTIAWFKNRQK
jgi:CDP-glucose 4,6-dehydratase